jgi:hypothetical protein
MWWVVLLSLLSPLLLAAADQGCTAQSRAALQVVEDYIAAFNTRDIRKFEATMHYPHVRLADGKVRVWETPAGQQEVFGALEKSIGWDHTRLEEKKVIQCGPDKVHVAVKVTRRRKDGTPIHAFDSLYVVTNQGGRWGIQIRSSYAPEKLQ